MAVEYCVIVNCAAGRGRANRRLEECRRALGDRAEFRATQRRGHAEDLALEAASSGFAVVAAAGGDGTVHEVANGVLRAARPEVICAVLPLGSANDYAHSLAFQPPGQNNATGVRTVDVGTVQAEDGRQRYFINTLGLGFSGAVTVESRRIVWLQGLALYGLAFVRALLFRYACPMMDVTFDGQARNVPTFSLTLALGRREGGFVVAPHALMDDGLFDYLHAGALSRWEVLRFLPKLASGGELPADYPKIWQGRCRQVRLRSTEPLTVHVDGEFFCQPPDKVFSLDIRLLPGALRARCGLPGCSLGG
jgi:diacylglycerol kinase (ATP)